MRRGQQDFGLFCPERFHSAAAAGAASVPENSEQTNAGGEEGRCKLAPRRPEPPLHSAGARFKSRSSAGSAIRRLPAAEVCRRVLEKTTPAPGISPTLRKRSSEAERSAEEGAQTAERSEPSFPAGKLQRVGGCWRGRTDHSSACGGQERTAPHRHLPSTIVVSLVPESSKLQTGARHSSWRSRGTGSQLLSLRRSRSLDTPLSLQPHFIQTPAGLLAVGGKLRESSARIIPQTSGGRSSSGPRTIRSPFSFEGK